MPRNGSGTFSLTTSFVSDTTISSTDVNALLTDVGAELTNSVAKDGQSSLTAQLKAFSGTVSLPGYGFASDTSTGFYRIAGSNIGLSLGGTKYFDFATTGLTITGVLSVSSTLSALGTIELGNASDTTLSRSSAGVLAVEGVTVPVNSTSQVATFGSIQIGHASDTTLTRASAGDIAVEGATVYRAGGTTVPVADGGTGAATAGSARSNLALAYASQAEQETGTATDRVVAPGTQKHHPCHPKASGRFNSGGAVLGTAFGVTSVSRTGTGAYAVTLSTAMADTNYGVIATPQATTTVAIMDITITSSTVFTINALNTGGTGVDVSICFAVFGDI